MLTSQTTEQRCPCGSGKPFAFCCEPFLEGVKAAPTAEHLMRSRYTAFVMGAIDYLIDTTTQAKRALIDRAILAEQVQFTTWTGLTILSSQAGTPSDSEGVVEFEATFEADDEAGILRERSNFSQHDGRWFYVDGDVELRSLA